MMTAALRALSTVTDGAMESEIDAFERAERQFEELRAAMMRGDTAEFDRLLQFHRAGSGETKVAPEALSREKSA